MRELEGSGGKGAELQALSGWVGAAPWAPRRWRRSEAFVPSAGRYGDLGHAPRSVSTPPEASQGASWEIEFPPFDFPFPEATAGRNWTAIPRGLPRPEATPSAAASAQPRSQLCLRSSRAALRPAEAGLRSLQRSRDQERKRCRRRRPAARALHSSSRPFYARGGEARGLLAGRAVVCAGSSPGPLGLAHGGRPVPPTAGHRRPASREY